MAVPLLHRKCGTACNLDLNHIYHLIAGYGIDGTLLINLAEIVPLNNKKTAEARFFCPQCKESFDPNDVISFCNQCGKQSEVKDLFTSDEMGGVYCAQCAEKYSIISLKPLEPQIKTVKIRNLNN